jgi:hypothetical protein
MLGYTYFCWSWLPCSLERISAMWKLTWTVSSWHFDHVAWFPCQSHLVVFLLKVLLLEILKLLLKFYFNKRPKISCTYIRVASLNS